MQYIYTTGFQNAHIGYASAASFVLMLILMAIALIQLAVNRRREARRCRHDLPATRRAAATPRRVTDQVTKRRRPAARTARVPPMAVAATALLWVFIIVFGFPVLWFVLSPFKPAAASSSPTR